MAVLANLARMTTATAGTGTITLGAAASGYLSFSDAGITDAQVVTYAIVDGANREIGRGVYTAAGTTLTRVVLKSTNAGSAVSLSGSAEVFIAPAAEDMVPRKAMVRKSADQTGANFTGAGAVLAFDQEVYDHGGWHDNVTNNSRLTVPAGVYFARFGGTVRWANHSNEVCALTVLKNGSSTFDGAAQNEATAANGSLNVSSGPIACVPGDYFELSLFTGTDTSADVTATRTNFWAEAVAG